MLTRRAILVTGGATLVVAGAGAGALALRADLSAARRPWAAAGGSFGDARLDALAYAILAPNPHNMQPWRVRLNGDNALTLFADSKAMLPATDPFNRQIVIGLGAFVELFRQAAAARGWSVAVTPFPEGEPQPVLDARPIASMSLARDGQSVPDPLFGAALHRRSARVPFDDRPLDEDALARLGDATRFANGETAFGSTVAADRVAAIKALARLGWETEVAAPAPHAESVRLTRIGGAEINASPDGVALGGPVMEAMRLAGLLSRPAMSDPTSRAHAETLDFYNGLIDASAGFGWLTTPGNSRIDQLNAGADWVRINLAATRTGIAMHPVSQTLQEFVEMAALYRRTHRLLGVDAPAVVQGLFRFGYTKAPPPSPRWPLESRLIVT